MKMYDHVDLLNQAKIDAAIVHAQPGFRVTWFLNTTRVVYPPLVLTQEDLLVIPEVYGDQLRTMAPGVPRLSLNQNAYHSFLNVKQPDKHPYITTPELKGVLVVSADTEEFIRYSFPGIEVRRFVVGLDPEQFFNDGGTRDRIIAYMPRRRESRAAQVLSILAARRVLDNWDVLPLEGRTHDDLARLLRRAAIFLSLSEQEGCPLPPLEAMASGAVVIGFTGLGGREYLTPEVSVPVAEDDVVQFAREVEHCVLSWDASRSRWKELTDRASRQVQSRYSLERERESVLSAVVPAVFDDRQPTPKGEVTLAAAEMTPGGTRLPGPVRRKAAGAMWRTGAVFETMGNKTWNRTMLSRP